MLIIARAVHSILKSQIPMKNQGEMKQVPEIRYYGGKLCQHFDGAAGIVPS